MMSPTLLALCAQDAPLVVIICTSLTLVTKVRLCEAGCCQLWRAEPRPG